MLINFKWTLVMKYIVRRLLIPYIVFMLSYMSYVHIKFDDANYILVPAARYSVIVVLIISCLYTLSNEAK